MELKPDIIQGSSYERDFISERLIERYIVTDLSAGSSLGLRDATYATETTTGEQIPEIGDSHPNAAGFICTSISSQPSQGKSRNAVVTVVWESFVPGAFLGNEKQLVGIRYNSGTQQLVTSYDKYGKMIFVPYQPGRTQAGLPYPDEPSETLKAQGWAWDYVKLPKLTPGATLDFVYRSKRTPLHYQNLNGPRGYNGTLNNRAWQGAKAGEWLCLGIPGRTLHPTYYNASRTSDNRLNSDVPGEFVAWEITFSFQWNPKPYQAGNTLTGGPGWSPLCIYHDPILGRTPSDVDPIKEGFPNSAQIGNGWKVADLYDEADFDALKLPKLID